MTVSWGWMGSRRFYYKIKEKKLNKFTKLATSKPRTEFNQQLKDTVATLHVLSLTEQDCHPHTNSHKRLEEHKTTALLYNNAASARGKSVTASGLQSESDSNCIFQKALREVYCCERVCHAYSCFLCRNVLTGHFRICCIDHTVNTDNLSHPISKTFTYSTTPPKRKKQEA